MRAVAIICEYNPFHSGHEYCISAARKACDCDTAIGIMSGFFVQRAEPAIIAPKFRAEAALNGGLDAVIQLPSVFSCAAGNIFATGAIRILSDINGIEYLAMGTEDDGEILTDIANAQLDSNEAYVYNLKSALNSGLPFATAICKATATALPHQREKIITDILKKPNNILAIEYIKAIKQLGVNIKPIFIKRLGNGYNDFSPVGDHISATAARELIKNGNFDKLGKYIPNRFLSVLRQELNEHSIDFNAYNSLIVNALRSYNISEAPDCGEGLDAKLLKAAKRFWRYEDILAECKSKRYTMARIKRICVQTLLQINSTVMSNSHKVIGKLIAIKESKKDIIKQMSNIAVKNSDYEKFGVEAVKIARIDEVAGSIYNIITHREQNDFFNERLLTL